MSHPFSAELQETLVKWQHFSPCLGTNVTIFDSDNGFWDSASGLRSLNPKQWMEPDERFYIYSITKTFTAIVVMRLVENDAILLDDPIVKYVPLLPLPTSITIRSLLNHTGGVPSYTDLSAYMPATKQQPSKSWSFEQVINLTCKSELDFQAGEKWHYSNTGYMLLLLMIESVTNEPFSKAIENYIVKNIGLKKTYVAEEVDNGSVTNGYCRYLNSEERIENITGKYDPWWCKTGLIVSTSNEVTKVYESLFSGKLVNTQSLHQMTEATPIMQSAGPHFNKPCYGLGLMIDPEAGYGGAYGHGGDGPGFNTWSVCYPDFYGRKIIITILCNTSMAAHPFYLVKDFLRVLKNG